MYNFFPSLINSPQEEDNDEDQYIKKSILTIRFKHNCDNSTFVASSSNSEDDEIEDVSCMWCGLFDWYLNEKGTRYFRLVLGDTDVLLDRENILYIETAKEF